MIVQFHIFRSTLNARMYLYNTPRDTMAKDLMLQSLFSTQFINQSSVLDLLTQHKTSCQSCAPGSTPNTNKHIRISLIIGLCPIYKTNHHVHMQWGPQTAI